MKNVIMNSREWSFSIESTGQLLPVAPAFCHAKSEGKYYHNQDTQSGLFALSSQDGRGILSS